MFKEYIGMTIYEFQKGDFFYETVGCNYINFLEGDNF